MISLLSRLNLGFNPLTGLIIGIATGLLSGLMGVGGGIIAVPAMVALLGVSQHRAHGTSLAMMILTASTSAIIYTSRGQVDWPLAILMTIGTVLGVQIGARVMNRISASRLRQFFGLFLLAVGLKMALSVNVTAAATQTTVIDLPTIVFGIGIGLIAGILSGLLGIGGGVIMVPAMVFMMGIGQVVAQGVSLVVIVPTALTGAYTHYKKGNVLPQLAIVLGLAAIIGAFIGSWLAGLADPSALQQGFGVFVIVVSIRLLYNEFFKKKPAQTTPMPPTGAIASPPTAVGG